MLLNMYTCRLLLANKVAVITGAASTVSKAIAQKILPQRRGASVFLADKELDKCRSFADELKKNKDPNDTQVAEAMPCDTSDWLRKPQG